MKFYKAAALLLFPLFHLRVFGVTTVVGSSYELTAALQAAQPGDTIRLTAKTVFSGQFTITRSGTSDAPIYLLGTETSILDGYGISSGEVVRLQASYIVLDGLVIQHGRTGVALDHASHNRIYGVTVRDTGAEGIVIHGESSSNTIENSTIINTGRDDPGRGIGIEVGSPYAGWCQTSDCKPDHSKANIVQTNHIGPGVTAQSIVVREGAVETTVNSNILNADDLSGEAGAHSFLDIAGSKTSVFYNQAELTVENHELTDGFVIHSAYPGFGDDSILSGNHIKLKGFAGNGYGLRLTNVLRTRICRNNVVDNAPLATEAVVDCDSPP